MEVKIPELQRFRNDEHNHLMSWTNDDILEIGADKLKIEPLYDEFAELLKLEGDANKEAATNFLTGDVRENDDCRDNIYKCGNYLILSAAYNFNPEIANAGNKLKVISDKYGNLARKPLAEETTAIRNFLQDVRKMPELIEIIPGLGDVFDELEKANEITDKKMKERKSVGAHSVPLKEIRFRIDGVFVKMMNAVNVFSVLSPSKEINEFIIEQNASVKRAEDALARRLGTNNGDQPEELGDEDKYPDAKEWEEDLPFQGVENGDIYYILVAGEKIFYKLVDKTKFFDSPDSAKGASGWEKLD